MCHILSFVPFSALFLSLYLHHSGHFLVFSVFKTFGFFVALCKASASGNQCFSHTHVSGNSFHKRQLGYWNGDTELVFPHLVPVSSAVTQTDWEWHHWPIPHSMHHCSILCLTTPHPFSTGTPWQTIIRLPPKHSPLPHRHTPIPCDCLWHCCGIQNAIYVNTEYISKIYITGRTFQETKDFSWSFLVRNQM